jgi:hypothetical protein
MPKLVGHRPGPADRPSSEAPEGTPLVPLTWAQAERVRARGGQVYYWLDTSDRGSRGRRAKRWYHWEASIADVLRADPTESMYERAAQAAMPPGLRTREEDEAAARAAEAKAAVERRCAALEAYVRPTCIRVLAPRRGDGAWRPGALRVLEALHDCMGTMADELPDDDAEAAAMLQRIQAGHDEVYHPRGA